MKQIISSKHLSTIIFLLTIVVTIKIIWLAISMLFLPTSGEELQQANEGKKLYYRVRLSNPSKVNVLPPKPKQNSVASMKAYKLLGLYNSEEKLVVTVAKGSKTTILAGGEKIDGFQLISSGQDFVIFKKSGQEFKLSLENRRNSKRIVPATPAGHPGGNSPVGKVGKIVEEGGTKHIPKTLLTSYTKDINKVWKDVGLSNYTKNGKPAGFKVNFVKKGSDIEKLGLQRGDILTAINAEPLNLSSAMNFFNGINDLDNLTLTVERNGISEDLEYEIQ